MECCWWCEIYFNFCISNKVHLTLAPSLGDFPNNPILKHYAGGPFWVKCSHFWTFDRCYVVISVPDWATGLGGCLLTELPSLTVLFIPEQSAIELTSDCGLDGTKRIACKGNVVSWKVIAEELPRCRADGTESRAKAPEEYLSTT